MLCSIDDVPPEGEDDGRIGIGVGRGGDEGDVLLDQLVARRYIPRKEEGV